MGNSVQHHQNANASATNEEKEEFDRPTPLTGPRPTHGIFGSEGFYMTSSTVSTFSYFLHLVYGKYLKNLKGFHIYFLHFPGIFLLPCVAVTGHSHGFNSAFEALVLKIIGQYPSSCPRI